MAIDANVQIPPDSSGKKIRTVEVTTLVGGSPVVVEGQVVVIANPNGSLVDFERLRSAIGDLVEAVSELNEKIEEMA